MPSAGMPADVLPADVCVAERAYIRHLGEHGDATAMASLLGAASFLLLPRFLREPLLKSRLKE